MASLDVRLKRLDMSYAPNDKVTGFVVVSNKGGFAHNGINLEAEGTVNLQLSARSSGLFEAFYSSLKPIKLFSEKLKISEGGKLPDGTVELPFEFTLDLTEGVPLLDSYRGVFVNIQYVIKVEVLRKKLSKNLSKSIEFYVKAPCGKAPEKLPKHYTITNESLAKSSNSTPNFSFKVNLHSSQLDITKPLTGEIFVEECAARVRSIELKLMRLEVIKTDSGNIPEESEIQNIQIAEGQVTRGLPIPMYMVFPNLYTCPSLDTPFLKLDFVVNIVVRLEHHQEVTQPVPLTILREKV